MLFTQKLLLPPALKSALSFPEARFGLWLPATLLWEEQVVWEDDIRRWVFPDVKGKKFLNPDLLSLFPPWSAQTPTGLSEQRPDPSVLWLHSKLPFQSFGSFMAFNDPLLSPDCQSGHT